MRSPQLDENSLGEAAQSSGKLLHISLSSVFTAKEKEALSS